MKKISLIILLLLIPTSIFGCQDTIKDFNKSGITITLTRAFQNKDVSNFQIYLESAGILFMGNGELKTEVTTTTLTTYTEAVLILTTNPSEIVEYNENGVTFMYAYYTDKDDKYCYMLITKEGISKYYTMCFACAKAELEKNKNQFMKWAKTINVE